MAYSSITKPEEYFNTKLYTGGNGSATTISGLDFAPDFAWCKDREGTGVHALMDRLRTGSYGHGWLRTDVSGSPADPENNTNGRGNISSFTSDGYVLSADTWGASNQGTTNHVAWNWRAGGSGSSNSNGSITSTVSANTTAGFSIVSYTGTGSAATIGHGLGVKPDAILVKNRDASQNWFVYQKALDASAPEDYYILLSGAAVRVNDATAWNDTAPTTSVFSVGSNDATNKSSDKHIAYCFVGIKGYSKFGSYVGNGNADGTFVYTGFKPAWVMLKANDSDNWYVKDNKRDVDNPVITQLFPNLSNADNTNSVSYLDFLSNGFKLRGTDSGINGNGNTNFYFAFAENPFVGNDSGTAVPVTAR